MDIQTVCETPADYLPPLNRQSLELYYHFLVNKLSLPFRAVYHERIGPREDATRQITVVDLCDPSNHPAEQGIICRAVRQGAFLELPLVEVEVGPDNPNFQLIENYWAWAWNELTAASAR